MPLILLTNRYSEKVLEVVSSQVPAGFEFLSLEKADKESLISKAGEADYFLASGRLAIDKEVIGAATKLKMIQRTGVGTDTLDLARLKQKGIPVYVNAGINSFSVAEHTVLLMLAVLRRLPIACGGVKAGKWEKNDVGIGCRSLSGKTIGMIGVGNIGKAVVTMLQAFGVEILYYKVKRLTPQEEKRLKLRYCTLGSLLKQVDILSINCPLNPQTRGLISRDEIASMKVGSFIINTGRGPIIDEEALISALQSGHIAGAGLDVFSQEPPGKDNPLLLLDNVVATPHVGGLTIETFSKMMRDAFENISLFEMGKLDLIENKKLKNEKNS